VPESGLFDDVPEAQASVPDSLFDDVPDIKADVPSGLFDDVAEETVGGTGLTRKQFDQLLTPGPISSLEEFGEPSSIPPPKTRAEADARLLAIQQARHEIDTRPMVPLRIKEPKSVAAGIYNAVAAVPEFFTSPLGTRAVIASAVGGPLVTRIGAGAFGADIIAHVPQQVKEIRAAVKEGPPGRAAEAITGGVLTPFLLRGLYKGATRPLPRAGEEPIVPQRTVEPTETLKPGDVIPGTEAPALPNARLAADFPIQEPYSDKFSVSVQVATPDPSAISKQQVLESLPPELRESVQEVRMFQGQAANPSIVVPSRIQLTFPDKASAQKAIDYFKAPQAEPLLEAPKTPATVPELVPTPENAPAGVPEAPTAIPETPVKAVEAAPTSQVGESAATFPPEPVAIAFPGIGSLREADATPMRLGQIRKSDPELWKAVSSYFGETQPGKITKAAQAAFKRMREQQSRAASAGPGAASPVEFEQRARERAEQAASGTVPPGDSPPVAVDAPSPSVEVVRANRDYNILNRVNSGQFAFSFGKLGQAAKAAWERMALGEFRMRESIGRDVKQYVDQLLDNLPRPFRKKGGEAFFDVVNGKRFEDIEAEWSGRDGGAEVIGAARELKTRLEEIRTTIRDTKRDAYTAYLNSLDRPILEDLFRKNIDDKMDISRYENESLSDALAKDAYRDDWGISDGSYLPHLFFGNWKVTVTDAAGESRFVTRSKTPEEAKAEIFKFVKRNPELAEADFKVEQDTVVPADMIRLGDRNFWNLVGKMKEATGMTQGEVREAQQGIIGKKSSKQKWFGSLQKREGYEGYSRDYRQVMTAYLNGFHRWLELSQMQREVQPLIETVRREGRQNAATRLDELMDNLWGKPARSTMEFDALVRRIPGLRDFIKPLALDRWSRNVRSTVAMLTLKTLRFALVNRLQPLQGLYPLVGERILAQAKIAQHTKEGRALLDEAGVSFDPGQYRAERATSGKLQTLSERFSGEKSNQELAFLAMFQHGMERGLSKPEAIKYAKLRGQLMTQFTPLIADTPALLHGPIAGALFQFKRFPVKQAELLTRMVQEKRFGGIARWLGVMAISGGASYFLRQVYADAEKKKRLRDRIAEQAGEKVADGVMYGLPGLIGADLSGSLVLGDEPFGDNVYERVGRSVTGPAVSLVIDTASALTKEKREPTTLKQDAVTLLRRFPTLRPLGELLSLDDLDVRTPDGEVRYRKVLKDALLGLGSFRSANESNIKLAIDAIIELKKEMAELKNQYFVESEKGDTTKSEAAIEKFNERWPELEITQRDINLYIKLRNRGADKTDIERAAGKKLESLVP